MAKGYQLVELAPIDDLVKRQEYDEFSVAILYWIISKIRELNDDRLKDVDLDLIGATYYGTYPTIGVHYKTANKKDVGPVVDKLANRILTEMPVSDLIETICQSGVSWRKLAIETTGRESNVARGV